MPRVKTVAGKLFDEYKPVKNPLDKNASFDGCMLETYGAELEVVFEQLKKDGAKIWTVLDGDGSGLVVVAGFHFVNRLGYIITEIPWESDTIEFDEDDRRVSN
jgi:hypothetical protein